MTPHPDEIASGGPIANSAARTQAIETRVDIETARAAGDRVWVVPTGSDTAEALEVARPDRRPRDLLELAELLS